MSPAPAELALPNSSSESLIPSSSSPRSNRASPFDELRGVRWRIDLGILPSSSSPIDDLRRVAADSRRRYASLRRRLLIDPPFPKDENKAPDLVMDNPLSQNPDSLWGRFFRNAELEKMVDQDLSRLYPEHGSYFQTLACQTMLRRILLLWCLRHPEYGYGQGMHELLAPLLYVLHVDVQRLSQVRKLYEDHFIDKFDETSYPQSNQLYTYKLKKTSPAPSTSWSIGNDDESSLHGSVTRVSNLDELDPDIRTILLLTDAYGAEGELGILLSEKFMEHDAYCMFDALMGGARGAVAMADFFSPSPAVGSITGLPPVIEASFALYHLLFTVDPSLHSHLVQLGVEPQYFALRWLRVLYGREFLLEDLLIIWDEIFASSNCKSHSNPEDNMSSNFGILRSPRGAYISAIAVSMLLHVRSSLLATENATSCLKRLLNFPQNINVKKLIEKANSLQALAFDRIISPSPSPGTFDGSKSGGFRRHSLSSGSISPRTPLNLFPESYWEEKWRVLHKAEEFQQVSQSDPLSAGTKGSSDKERSALVRTESAPSSTKTANGKRESVRRRLLEDLTQETESDSDLEKLGGNGIVIMDMKDPLSVEVEVEKGFLEGQADQNEINNDFTFTTEETCLNGNAVSEDNLSIFSTSTSPLSRANDHENDSEKSSVTSNLSIDGNDEETNNMEDLCSSTISEDRPLQHSEPSEVTQSKLESNTNVVDKQAMALKERKPLSGKFQWLWKFSRNGNSEGNCEKRCNVEAQRPENVGNAGQLTADGCTNSSGFCSGVDTTDKNVMGTLRNLGQSMLENIQVMESVFQQDRGKGQVAAVAALKELRKISNLLSEM